MVVTDLALMAANAALGLNLLEVGVVTDATKYGLKQGVEFCDTLQRGIPADLTKFIPANLELEFLVEQIKRTWPSAGEQYLSKLPEVKQQMQALQRTMKPDEHIKELREYFTTASLRLLNTRGYA